MKQAMRTEQPKLRADSSHHHGAVREDNWRARANAKPVRVTRGKPNSITHTKLQIN